MCMSAYKSQNISNKSETAPMSHWSEEFVNIEPVLMFYTLRGSVAAMNKHITTFLKVRPHKFSVYLSQAVTYSVL